MNATLVEAAPWVGSINVSYMMNRNHYQENEENQPLI